MCVDLQVQALTPMLDSSCLVGQSKDHGSVGRGTGVEYCRGKVGLGDLEMAVGCGGWVWFCEIGVGGEMGLIVAFVVQELLAAYSTPTQSD